MYLVEDRLLENDFYFEAMDGLEQLPWEQCQQHLEETESRLVKEFSINEGTGISKSLTLSLIGLLASALVATWYFTSGPPTTVDLTPAPKNEIDNAANNQELRVSSNEEPIQEQPSEDSISRISEEKAAKDLTPEIEPEKPKPADTKPVPVNADAVTHITVGRIIDTKGLAIPNAVVTTGKVSDTTDKSGYFALKVARGGTRIKVTHLATDYPVEIDTNQNWEIVLDIANQVVYDYHPMNAANRFK